MGAMPGFKRTDNLFIMFSHWPAVLTCVGLSVVTVAADFLIKKASEGKGFSEWPLLLVGGAIYALTAIGWFFVMRHLELSTLGALYAVTCVLLLSIIGVLSFQERIVPGEMVGIGFAIVSLVLLARFA